MTRRYHKLRDLTTLKFVRLLQKHNGRVRAVAEELEVTPQAMYAWVKRNCRRKIVYECAVPQNNTIILFETDTAAR